MRLQRPRAGRLSRWHCFAFVAYVVALLISLGMRWSSDWRPPSAGALGDIIAKGSVSRRLALLGLAGVAATLVVRGRRGIRVRSPAVAVAWIAFLAVAVVSVSWSVDVGLTVRRVTVLLILALSGTAFTRTYGMKGLAALILVVAGGVTAVGIAAAISHGTIGPLQGRFGGVVHPVTESWHCSLMFLACLGLACWHREYRRLLLLAAAFSFLLLLATRTRSALAATVVATGVFGIMTLHRRPRTVLMMAGTGAVFAVSLVLFVAVSFPSNRNAALREVNPVVSLGRQESTHDLRTLTTRTPLWNYLIRQVREKPYIGYGYDSFFSATRLEAIAAAATWGATSEHSMYLETLLGLGGVGLAAFISTFVLGLMAIANRWAGTIEGAFSAAILVWTLVVGVVEAAVATNPVLPTLAWMGVIGWVAFRDVRNQGTSDNTAG